MGGYPIHVRASSRVGGDQRMSGVLNLSIRYIDDAGRSRSFTAAEWNAAANTQFEDDSHTASGSVLRRGHGVAGLVVFNHLPAGPKVIVGASKSDPTANIMILEPNELRAYTKADGATGGLFGDNGGFSHTVALCPLEETAPQDHNECGSFAYVDTHGVTGQVWTNQVVVDPAGDDFIVRQGAQSGPTQGRRGVPGTTVSMDPVDGKNLAGVSKSFTAAASNSRSTPQDDRKEIRFGRLAAGVYALNIPEGWRATEAGPDDDGGLDRDALGAEVNLMGDLQIDVTPATGILYGKVTDSDGFAVEDAAVSVNNVSVTTDSKGRFIASGVESVIGIDGRPTNPEYRNEPIVAIAASMDGFRTYGDTLHFGPTVNNPTEHAVALSGVVNTIFITGQITNILTGDGIGGVEVKVDGVAPLNKEARSWHDNYNKLVSASDGTYSAQIRTKDRGQTARVSVARDRYHFPVDNSPVLADGNSPAVVNFQGYENGNITGTVAGPTGRALADVSVTATSTAAAADADPDASATTNAVGQFTLNVPPVSTYRIDAVLEGHIFEFPNNNQTAFAGPGQTISYGRIQARTAGALDLDAERQRVADDATTTEVDESTRTWAATTEATFTADSTDVPVGYANATYTIETSIDDGETWTDASATQTEREEDSNDRTWSFTSAQDGAFMVRAVATAANDGTVDPQHTEALVLNSEPVTVAAIDPSASGVTAQRQAATGADQDAAAGGDFIYATWNAVANASSDFRMVVEVTPASLGGNSTVWVVLADAAAADRDVTSAEIGDTYSASLGHGSALRRRDSDGHRHRSRPQGSHQGCHRVGAGYRGRDGRRSEVDALRGGGPRREDRQLITLQHHRPG